MVFFTGKESIINIYLELKDGTVTKGCAQNNTGNNQGEKNTNLVSKLKNVEYYTINLVAYLGVFIIAYFVEDLGSIMPFIGISASLVLGFVLPSLYFLQLYRDEKMYIIKAICCMLVVVGSTLFIVCTYHYTNTMIFQDL